MGVFFKHQLHFCTQFFFIFYIKHMSYYGLKAEKKATAHLRKKNDLIIFSYMLSFIWMVIPVIGYIL